MRLPTPYGPPGKPVFISHTCVPFSAMFFARSLPYTVGCSGMKAAPKQAEKVACGSFTPISVPATLAV